MYTKIMVPVDLAQIERLDKAITTATDLAKHYGIPICFVGVTAETPTEVAHTPKEFAEKLNLAPLSRRSTSWTSTPQRIRAMIRPSISTRH